MRAGDNYDDRIWNAEDDDARSPYERDRDRILYCSAFRRLAGVTQVVSPAEGHVFHNRLTHSLEVAQIAKRLAEKLQTQSPRNSEFHGIIDSDVTEAAALAHDLGHPPFGHVAEKELDSLVRTEGKISDGYEGNAQAFRIVTKLAVRKAWWTYDTKPKVKHDTGEYGLNLTRAVLNAILKYPRTWAPHGKASEKWGVYKTEEKEFDWVRGMGPPSDSQSIEAAIMDWSDDIAYSVHDTEDFYRAGLIPLDRLRKDQETRNVFLAATKAHWSAIGKPVDGTEWDRLAGIFDSFCDFLPINEPYVGTSQQD